MNNKNLLEQLFGTILEKTAPKHLTEEEWKYLHDLGYNPNDWDHWLDIKKVTKEDVKQRIDLEKRRLELDQNLRKRWESKRPQIKVDDVITTKKYGKLMIRSTDNWGIVAYSSMYGELIKMSWEMLTEQMESK